MQSSADPSASKPGTDDRPSAGCGVPSALSALAELDIVDLSAHPDVYDRIHTDLRSALAEIDHA